MSECYTIAEWCKKRKTSRSGLYNLRKAGNAPRITLISPRKLIITEEDDEAWVRERQADAKQRGVK